LAKYNLPDERGHFGPYGGKFVAETLMGPIEELRQAYEKYMLDEDFLKELDWELQQYVGRPSPLYFATLEPGTGWCQDLSETRRPESHWCPQGE
jgi:tryptophan synthase beta subunit